MIAQLETGTTGASVRSYLLQSYLAVLMFYYAFLSDSATTCVKMVRQNHFVELNQHVFTFLYSQGHILGIGGVALKASPSPTQANNSCI
jgi:hypothetical protein